MSENLSLADLVSKTVDEASGPRERSSLVDESAYGRARELIESSESGPTVADAADAPHDDVATETIERVDANDSGSPFVEPEPESRGDFDYADDDYVGEDVDKDDGGYDDEASDDDVAGGSPVQDFLSRNSKKIMIGSAAVVALFGGFVLLGGLNGGDETTQTEAGNVTAPQSLSPDDIVSRNSTKTDGAPVRNSLNRTPASKSASPSTKDAPHSRAINRGEPTEISRGGGSGAIGAQPTPQPVTQPATQPQAQPTPQMQSPARQAQPEQSKSESQPNSVDTTKPDSISEPRPSDNTKPSDDSRSPVETVYQTPDR